MLRVRPLDDSFPRRPVTTIAIALVCVSLIGCGFFRGGTNRPESASRGVGQSAVEVRSIDERPRLSLVNRSGDPSSAVVVAVAHDQGSIGSAVMAALLEHRLRRDFADLDALAYNGGYVVRAVVTSPLQAASFVTEVSNALRTPAAETEPEAVARRLKSFSFETWTAEVDAAVGKCSGELGLPAPATIGALDRQRIETYRVASYSSQAVAFAAVGPRQLLDAASTALERTPAWPEEPEPENEWPRRDVVGVSTSRLASSTVSIALRVADPARALGAARLLAEPDSALSARVDALEPPYRIDQVTAATHPRGACVRVDLLPSTNTQPGPADAAWAAALVVDEVMSTVARTPADPWFLDDGILGAADPRDAASIAAWRSLSNRLDGGPDRIAVSYRVPTGRTDPATAAVLAQEFAAARSGSTRSTLDIVERVEKGQGQLWMLLGSPCGTATESNGDAGRRALVVRTLAEKNPRIDGVSIEPWITPDGIGLLAHAPLSKASERFDALAERVAGALGRAVAATRIDERHAAAARTALQESVEPERAPLWSVALEALAPGHPSFLDPRGTFQSIISQSGEDAENERRALLKGPLRLAVIANHDDAQVTLASRALERWLRPLRRQQYRCAATSAVVPRIGEYVVETTTASAGAHALVAASFIPSASRGLSREAEWTLVLLNRQGGWLESALRLPGLASDAQAVLLGGRAAAGFVIEVSVVDEHMREAVAQVRALLARLAAGAASPEDVEAARRYDAEVDSHARFDPRRRVVDLWLQRSAGPAPDLASLRRFHQIAFAADRHIVVLEKPK